MKILKLCFILILLSVSYKTFAVSKDKVKVKVHSKVNVARTISNASKDDLTFNYEADIYRVGTTSNFSANYTIDGWSVGLAMYNIQFIGPTASDNNNFQVAPFLSISKTLFLTDTLSLQLGTQLGTVLVNLAPRPFYIFEYGVLNKQLTDWLSIQSGVYHGNKDITYTVGTTGYIMGTQIDLMPKELVFQGTYVSGNNNVSGATINLLYSKYKMFQPYIGVGVPEKNNGNEFYGILGFNLTFLN
jgi:hypothetical protein